MRLAPIADLTVDRETGKTQRQINRETPHKIPLGALVEVHLRIWWGDGAGVGGMARLFVIEHERDCDGTPMYALGNTDEERWSRHIFRGYLERDLTVIEQTHRVREGYDLPEWLEPED